MDILATLQECSLRSVAFPIISIKETFGHDVPQHKSMDRDGAFIENTGRNPFVFSIVAPFYAKTLLRGKNETWDDLYPARFELLRNACIERSTTDFVHPLYGTFRVKVIDWDSTLNADERGGQTVALTVIETRDDGVSSAFTQSTQSRVRSTAVDLDKQLRALSPSPLLTTSPKYPTPVFTAADQEKSFEDMVNKLLRVNSTSALDATQALARIDRAVVKLDRVAKTIDRSAIVTRTDPLTGAVVNLGRLGGGEGVIWTNCKVLTADLYDLRRTITSTSNNALSVFITPKAMMLPTIATRLSSSVEELNALNPDMKRGKLTVPANTTIRYYKKA